MSQQQILTGVSDREIKREPTTERTKKLRDMLFKSKSSVSPEFTCWYTKKWLELEGELPIIRRAEAMKAAYSHLTPVIFPGELLVMTKAAYLKGTHPQPWMSESFLLASDKKIKEQMKDSAKSASSDVATWGEGGSNITSNLEDVVSIGGKFGIRKEEYAILTRTAEVFIGKSVEDICSNHEKNVPHYSKKEAIMRSVLCLYDSGYLMPQGREVMNFYYPLQYGIDGIIKICKDAIDECAGNPEIDKLYFYKAAILVLEGIKQWILNYSKEARFLASIELDEVQQNEYLELAERLELISSKPPKTFKDALQMAWSFHLAVLNEDVISGHTPGRLGQVLYPFWKNDKEKGLITDDETIELLECMRVKYTQLENLAPEGINATVLSGNAQMNIVIGGMDMNTRPANNDLEMLIIESAMTCATPQPTLSLFYDDNLPEEFLLKGAECVKIGTGYPSWINNRVGMRFMLQNFKEENITMEDARAWALGGCLDSSPGCWMPLKLDDKTYYIPGGCSPSAGVGVNWLGYPKILEIVLFDGIDIRKGERIFEPHGFSLDSYENILKAYDKYFHECMEVLVRTNNIQYDIWGKLNPPVINSLLKPDCLTLGKDLGQQGCRYNTTFQLKGSGGVNLVNSLASIKKNIFEDKAFTLEELKDAIRDNFGYKNAQETGAYSFSDQVMTDSCHKWKDIHNKCLSAPKFGNDDSYVDKIYRDWVENLCESVHQYRSLWDKPLYLNTMSVSTHGPLGAVTLASADGRLGGTSYADGSVSAYPGTDTNGPYALFNSATCWNQSLAQNSMLNLKLHPSVINGRKGTKKLLELIKGYMQSEGFHIQFNIVDSRMLKDAQKHPEKYQGLMVRVAGFTQYWAELGKQMQDDVIARTEYQEL